MNINEIEDEISNIFDNEYFDNVCDIKELILEYSNKNGVDILDININDINNLIKDFSSYIDILHDNLTFDDNEYENNNYNNDHEDYNDD